MPKGRLALKNNFRGSALVLSVCFLPLARCHGIGSWLVQLQAACESRDFRNDKSALPVAAATDLNQIAPRFPIVDLLKRSSSGMARHTT